MLVLEHVQAAEGRRDLLLRGQRHAVDPDGAGDVLHRVLAKIEKVEGEAVADLGEDGVGDAQATGRG